MYEDDDLLPLSALQHFLFCERQCALIHVEQVWKENLYTAEGRLMHERAHSQKAEGRPGKKTEFGMPIRSLELGLSGKTDSVEYRKDGSVIVVEYKRGRPKKHRADEVQLCAQALCLEEMKGITIQEGALYYGKARRRKHIIFTSELRELTRKTAFALHNLIEKGVTPKTAYDNDKCPRCSLLEFCIPKKLGKRKNVASYLLRMTGDEVPS